MTSLHEYGQHTWHYVYNSEAKAEVTFKNHCTYCNEVVEEFANYLMATGLFQTNVIEAFQGYIDEHKPALISAVKRLNGEEDGKYNVFSNLVGESE
jgi:hypothetical protein